MNPYDILFYTFTFFLGACIGSFLNVCIYRLPLNLSVNEPKRSFCPSCKYQIPWHHNLPLISWLALRGKCGNCGSRIAFRYFGVELLTALVFLGVWHWSYQRVSIMALPLWIMASLFIVATFIDFEHYIIPDEITWGGAMAGVAAMSFVAPLTTPGGNKGHFFAGLVGFTILIAGFWLARTIGGPIREMRSPKLFFALSLGGIAAAYAIDYELVAKVSASAIAKSTIGAAIGYFLIWGVVEAGKLAFGKKKIAFPKEEGFTWTRHDDDADLVVGEEKSLWSEFFSRPTDRLVMKCQVIKINGERFENVEAVFHYDRLQIGEKSWQLIKLDTIAGQVREIVIPREAMGFGDVKYMACIGAFLGWEGVIFTLVAASIIGALVGILTIAIGKREWSAKIPFGPYLSIGAMIWLFCGWQIVAWYWSLTHPA
jgi:leader peptidase (prepilin peptidase)/N-methyltransferase